VPICMPGDEAQFTGRVATVTGWGRLKYGGGVPALLQEVQVIFTHLANVQLASRLRAARELRIRIRNNFIMDLSFYVQSTAHQVIQNCQVSPANFQP
jgi:hypothetical protein